MVLRQIVTNFLKPYGLLWFKAQAGCQNVLVATHTDIALTHYRTCVQYHNHSGLEAAMRAPQSNRASYNSNIAYPCSSAAKHSPTPAAAPQSHVHKSPSPGCT